MTTTVDPATPAAGEHQERWSTRSLCGDILAEAYRPDAAPPVAVHVRPELCELLLEEPTGSTPPTSLPLVVDDDIPTAPGYEIHRAPPPLPGTG